MNQNQSRKNDKEEKKKKNECLHLCKNVKFYQNHRYDDAHVFVLGVEQIEIEGTTTTKCIRHHH